MNKRKRWMRRLAALCVLVSLSVGAVPADAAYPPPQGRVNDFANVLDDTTRAALQGIIQDAEQKTTAEIAVATVTSLDGMTVEQYAEGLFREWGIGKKGADNGVLVLVCPSERQMRIEVGYGLEGVLPDGLAGEVIRTHFTPAFREDDYSRGVLQGVGRIAEIVRANHVLTPEELRALEEQEQGRPPAWLMTPFFGLFIALGGVALGVGLRTRSVFPLLWGGLFGGIPMVMSLIPFFNAALWILIPLAFTVIVIGYVRGAGWEKSVSTAGSGSGSGGRSRSSSGSSWSSGSSSSSSSSSSGSSFGGGRSGGGGASGSW